MSAIGRQTAYSSAGGRFAELHLSLPRWVEDEVVADAVYPDQKARMELVVSLARKNVELKTGGPFGAAVFERESGRLIAPGVNVVIASRCSLAHAEAMAIALAQQALQTHDLAAPGLTPFELVTSAQPCCQCLGVVWWSGVSSLVIGARKEDVEGVTGFREGPVADGWISILENRPGVPISVARDVLRERAIIPLREYHELGEPPFNPGVSR